MVAHVQCCSCTRFTFLGLGRLDVVDGHELPSASGPLDHGLYIGVKLTTSTDTNALSAHPPYLAGVAVVMLSDVQDEVSQRSGLETSAFSEREGGVLPDRMAPEAFYDLRGSCGA